MNTNSQNASVYKAVSGAGPENAEGSPEATLRVIAQLPAPDGLEDRVMDGLKTEPRRGRILNWPGVLQPGGSWMRGAAAAAIVFVVAGGGWGIYTRVQPGQPVKVIVMPRAGTGGGFSNAGAMRTPQTLSLPLVAAPVVVQTKDVPAEDVKPVLVKPLKRIPAKVVPLTKARAKARAGVEASVPAATK
jgi:hypothetical protein